ncbi:MAG: cysteine dioxygenase [Alphaproteobacteria bacterium]|nr:MAG: cysteine dioxygenase [Alphaproteobacteria bacterium]
MNSARLRGFVGAMTALADQVSPGLPLMEAARPLLADLVAQDDWLPAFASVSDGAQYRQYLLHCDSAERFSLVSFVWGPGQQTPIHDHQVWGLIGMLRGSEISRSYRQVADGGLVRTGPSVCLEPGQIEAVGPGIGDIHKVSNAHADRVSISIHLYGSNIGTVRRHSYQANGSRMEFVSGYSAATASV